MNKKILEALQTALQQLKIEYTEQIIVEKPNNKVNGDYSSNIAMRLAKQLHKNPMEIAETISQVIKEEYIENIKDEKTGFINYY